MPETYSDDLSDYVYQLDAASLEVAKKELHEDPKNLMGAVETLRQWITQQKHLKFTKDTRILLAYLRYAKFSQLKARQAIENHITAKTETPAWLDSFNPLDPSVGQLIKTGLLIPLKGYDDKGCVRVIYRASAYDPGEWKHKKDVFARAMYTISFFLMYDERVQVNGIVYLSDMTGLTLGHQTFWNLDETRKLMKFWQNTVPARYKGFHQYNCGPIWEAMMAMVMPFLSKKMKDRIIMCGSNLEDVYKTFPREILPVEYLPDDYNGPNGGTIDQITDDLMEKIRQPEMLRYLHLISSAEWKIDKAAKPDDVPNASFRKLNVD